MTKIYIQNNQSQVVVEGLENVKQQILNLIGSKFFHVTFVKTNGEVRELHGQFNGYEATGEGKPMPVDSMRVYEREGKHFDSFKSFKIDRLKEIRCGDIVIKGEMYGDL